MRAMSTTDALHRVRHTLPELRGCLCGAAREDRGGGEIGARTQSGLHSHTVFYAGGLIAGRTPDGRLRVPR